MLVTKQLWRVAKQFNYAVASGLSLVVVFNHIYRFLALQNKVKRRYCLLVAPRLEGKYSRQKYFNFLCFKLQPFDCNAKVEAEIPTQSLFKVCS